MYRYGNRNQMMLLPPNIEDYVSKDHPVRAYDVFVETLNLSALGIVLNPDKVGNSSYHPKSMLKLLVYGYSYGVRSSRKLEREVVNNLSFIWLMGGLRPDHKTIAEFRRKHKSALKGALKQCARLCMDLGLIDGNTLFVDGTKIKANASIKHNWNKNRCQKSLTHIDQRIESILSECERIDTAEQGSGSYVRMEKGIANAQDFQTKVKELLKKMEQENKTQINTTDPECRSMNTMHGSHPAYNNQIVVDEKHGLIVSSDTTTAVSDINQFAEQIEYAHETLGKPCQTACADAGYDDTDEMEKIASQQIQVVIAPRTQRKRQQDLIYDKDNDCFICQAGKRLVPKNLTSDSKSRVYRIEDYTDCQQCRRCTDAKRGRATSRLLKEDIREQIRARYHSLPGKKIYAMRKQKVELPFGHIKRNLKFDSFLLRGRAGAQAEFSLAACCFNITRMITLLGVPALIAKLTA